MSVNTCKLRVEDIIDRYTKYGWFTLTDIFNKQSFGKEKNVKIKVDKSLLKLLGDIRLYIIENTFNCVNKNKDTYYVAFGSTNITSDYDLTIVGKNASQVMYDMFHLFLNKYKNTLPYTYDSNIYPDGLYLSKGINKNIKQVTKLDDKHSIILPYTDKDYIHSISMACIKLLELNIDTTIYPSLHKFIFNSKKLNTALKNDYNKMYKLMKNKYKKNKYNKDTIDLITRVELNYKNSKKLYKVLYGNYSPNNIIKYQTTSSYFSIEAYYASPTIAVVVYEIQAKKKMNLQKNDYICAILENLGDMYHHIKEELKHSDKPIKSVLLKYSKYIYRIYFCLNKLLKTSKISNITKKINSQIIPNRKTGNTKNIDFSLIHYNNETPEEYISKFVHIILKHVESCITL